MVQDSNRIENRCFTDRDVIQDYYIHSIFHMAGLNSQHLRQLPSPLAFSIFLVNFLITRSCGPPLYRLDFPDIRRLPVTPYFASSCKDSTISANSSNAFFLHTTCHLSSSSTIGNASAASFQSEISLINIQSSSTDHFQQPTPRADVKSPDDVLKCPTLYLHSITVDYTQLQPITLSVTQYITQHPSLLQLCASSARQKRTRRTLHSASGPSRKTPQRTPPDRQLPRHESTVGRTRTCVLRSLCSPVN